MTNMKTYKKLNDCCVVVTEEGNDPYVVKLEQRQAIMQKIKEQRIMLTAKESELEAEIQEILHALETD